MSGSRPRIGVITANIHTVPKARLVKYAGTLDSETMLEVSRKVVLALGLENAL